jgi:glycosyltransferase involved in cell wall biosynthesis
VHGSIKIVCRFTPSERAIRLQMSNVDHERMRFDTASYVPERCTSRTPSISVIMPNYNHGKWLPRSIGAILAQEVSSLEIILIDDGSTDNSLEVIAGLCKRHDCIRLIRHGTNLGPYAAVRSGIAAARGEFLLLAAADDFILPGLLVRADAALRAHPDAAFFCSQVALVDRVGRMVGYRPVIPPRSASGYTSPAEMRREIQYSDNWFVGPSVVYRRSRIADIGYFDESLGTLCDGLATRLLGFRHGFYFDVGILAAWMVDPASLSAQTSLSAAESRRVRAVGARWIADHFPVDIRESYKEIFDRRFRFNMARQHVVWRGKKLDPGAICDVLDWGPRERSLMGILCHVPRIAPVLLLAFMTLRLRPISMRSLMARWWQVRVIERRERAMLQRRLAQACEANIA